MHASIPGDSSTISLLMLSGGIDSAALLVQTLASGRTVWVHHVHLQNQEGRWRREAEACERLVDWCRAEYPDRLVQFTVSTYAMPLPRFGYDAVVVHFIAAQVLRNHLDFDEVRMGFNRDDAQDPSFAVRFAQAQAVFRAAFDPVANPRHPVALSYPLYPNGDKRALWESLPPAVRNLPVTCRRPNGSENCGVCKGCLALQRAGIWKDDPGRRPPSA